MPIAFRNLSFSLPTSLQDCIRQVGRLFDIAGSPHRTPITLPEQMVQDER